MIRLLVALLTISPTLLQAQVSVEEEILQQLPPTFTNAGPVGTTEIRQDGVDHQAVVQTEDSYVRVQQTGEANLLHATQQGANAQWLIQQQGARNQYTGTVVGDNNQIEIRQRGEDNLIQQDVAGDNLRYRLTQEGQGNQLIQLEHDPLAPAYEVHQQGQGMRITIEQGFVGLPPLKP